MKYPPETPYYYFGRTIPYNEYLLMKVKQNRGQCPFCDRNGLTNRYGSMKKHMRACANSTKQSTTTERSTA